MLTKNLATKKLSIQKSTLVLDWQKNITESVITVHADQALTYVLLYGFGNVQPRRIQIFLKDNASVRIAGIVIGNKRQDLRCDLSVIHEGKNTTSFVNLRGIFTDQATALLNGTIHITPGGHNANARLEERVLLLSSEAHAQAIPNLEIEANDVIAGHAATVSKISDDELFYVQSRGLSPEAAEAVLVLAFIAAPLQNILESPLRKILEKAVARKILQII